ncbi:MAG: hypothetical protein EOO46_04595 [Flavobacterium sp.]|nr:MAG: hypothetical protein EOO46_04595 [Flavobacterium sp.]
MIIILIATIVLLSVVIFYLNINFHKQKRVFSIKIKALEEVIVEISKEQMRQSNQLKISDEFDVHFKAQKAVIGRNVFDLNLYLFDLLSKNDLLRK